ncbi:colorectal cancer-associated protein 2 isoform X2 [Protopterus annectens]|uniref:colorectal cancer-associated protein 2 isoform X2 n=1 Tax=Protopterus annectens TaxID=7888 RepID=UPI001CFB146F|nr:colorectal cancer-associated protein 2 isoform X2 [Protopterus annectens]
MSEKPKVYQGVRVKITVKELLQQKRAVQAAATSSMISRVSNGQVYESSSSASSSSSSSPSYAAPCLDSLPSASEAVFFQNQPFLSSLPCDDISLLCDNQQGMDRWAQPSAFQDNSYSSLSTSSYCTPCNFQSMSVCNTSMGSNSSLESSHLSGSLEYNPSPSQFFHFNPANFSSPSHMDGKSFGYPSEDYTYQQYNSSVCYCPSCMADPIETMKSTEYFSYPGIDCLDYSSNMMADDFVRREMNSTWDTCYG